MNTGRITNFSTSKSRINGCPIIYVDYVVSHEPECDNFHLEWTGMVAALTNESATSKSVYFAHCTSEMIFITHLLAEEPERLAGPLLADTYVTLLKGRNAWYGQKLAKGEINLDMGDSIKGKGMIQVMMIFDGQFRLCLKIQQT